jgi:hypothetical protein
MDELATEKRPAVCHRCLEPVPPKAERCPHCGDPLPKAVNMPLLLSGFGLLLVILVAFFALRLMNSGGTAPPPPPDDPMQQSDQLQTQPHPNPPPEAQPKPALGQ